MKAILIRYFQEEGIPSLKLSCGHAAGVLTVAMDAKGQTLYEKMVEGRFFLGNGS